MGQLKLKLPDSLHHQLQALAKSEGVSLSQYILYILTRQVTLHYQVHAVPIEEVERQQIAFAKLLDDLGRAGDEEIEQVLREREMGQPEPELTPEVVERLRKRIAMGKNDSS
ncbi:MAG: toxin-antitoxin system HicB family antitoxin [Calditrichaeota bacterium]|nr:MAG: toxin-antitoxin system HicB family antitoxin [Calditrichota bacterium]